MDYTRIFSSVERHYAQETAIGQLQIKASLSIRFFGLANSSLEPSLTRSSP